LNTAPERLTDERVLRPEKDEGERLEQARVADLLQGRAHPRDIESGKNEKENSDE
jgi:hypothetical protein